MGGVFGVFGADFMFKQHLGFNGEYSFRFAQAPYLPLGGLNYRPGSMISMWFGSRRREPTSASFR